MKLFKLLSFLLLLLISFNVSASKMIDLIMLEFLENKLPTDMYDEIDIPWEHGTYSIKVLKNGKSTFVSTDTTLKTRIPVKVSLKAHILKDVGFAKIAVSCVADFVTNGLVELVPDKKLRYKQTQASINIPIPEVNMNCDGIQIPITNTLKNMIEGNKLKWEARIKDSYNKFWKQ